MITLSDFIDNNASLCFDSIKTLLLLEDCPYAMGASSKAIAECLNRYVLGFDTEFDDDGDIVLTWIKLSAEC